ncbi:MAG: FmdB family zinc ribbon protein [Acidiferrobacterales bacterium]
MPIYEYRCGGCGHELEVMQRVNDPALKKCPACGKLRLRKLVSAAGFQLKGTGWYVTDFRDKDKKKPKADAESASTDKSKDKSTGKSKDNSKEEKKQKKASASSGSDD